MIMRSSRALGLALLMTVLLLGSLAFCQAAKADVRHGTIRPPHGATITGGVLYGTYDLRAGNVTLRNVEVIGAEIGIILGPGSVVRDSYIHGASMTGIHAYAHGEDWHIQLINNRVVDNGSQAMEGHAASGIKLLALSHPNHAMGSGATIVGNTVIGNHGNGIWLDQSSNASTIENNIVRNNTRHGIRCEICGGNVVIRGNTISGSGYDGIDVTSSGVVSVVNNDVTTSKDWDITIHGDWRAKKSWPTYGDPHVGWRFHSVTLSSNHANRVNGCGIAAVKC